MNLNFLKRLNKNTILIGIAVIGVIIVGTLIYVNSNKGFSMPSIFGISDEQVGKNVVDYINNNQLSQTPASLVSVSRESGLVKVKIKIGTSEFDSYATKDGKFLFPQAFDMSAKKTDTPATADANKTPVVVTKTDSPMLEAFVVARCPYGLQMQRAMAEAVKNVPALAQYMKVRYMGSISNGQIYSMHDVDTNRNPIPNGPEAKENLRQICIRDEQPTKYWNYVSCQMKTGDTAGCEKSTTVDSAKLNACMADPARGIADAQKDFDLSAKYSVQGSPTLILNGATISESNYGGRSSDGVRSMICAGFNSESSFCSTKLNTAAAAASFSATYESTAAASSGNSGATGANCAPAQ